MGAALTKSVLAGGRVFPIGTAREGVAAEVIPGGAWWSDADEAPSEDEVTQEPEGDADEAPSEPARKSRRKQ